MTLGHAEERETASRAWILAFGIYIIILNLLLLYVLLRLWPGEVPLKAESMKVTFIPGVWVQDVWPEARFLALVAVAGALGSYIHLATSFADYVGNRRFVPSWTWYYVLKPFIGAALALILYFVIRGGLFAANASVEAVSPYGAAAVAGLAGMFTQRATDKLREIFENLFRTEKPPERADPLKPANENKEIAGAPKEG